MSTNRWEDDGVMLSRQTSRRQYQELEKWGKMDEGSKRKLLTLGVVNFSLWLKSVQTPSCDYFSFQNLNKVNVFHFLFYQLLIGFN